MQRLGNLHVCDLARDLICDDEAVAPGHQLIPIDQHPDHLHCIKRYAFSASDDLLRDPLR
jgi:hypothetical protein